MAFHIAGKAKNGLRGTQITLHRDGVALQIPVMPQVSAILELIKGLRRVPALASHGLLVQRRAKRGISSQIFTNCKRVHPTMAADRIRPSAIT